MEHFFAFIISAEILSLFALNSVYFCVLDLCECVYCWSKHLRLCLYMSAQVFVSMHWVCVCLHRLIYQNKCLWLPADGWPLGPLWSPLSHHVVEIEGRRGKSWQRRQGRHLLGEKVFVFNPLFMERFCWACWVFFSIPLLHIHALALSVSPGSCPV